MRTFDSQEATAIANGAHVTFTGEAEWEAMLAAQRFITERGWSVGPTDSSHRRAVMVGDYDVAKWHNLRRAEKSATHLVLAGSNRHGPLVLRGVVADDLR